MIKLRYRRNYVRIYNIFFLKMIDQRELDNFKKNKENAKNVIGFNEICEKKNLKVDMEKNLESIIKTIEANECAEDSILNSEFLSNNDTTMIINSDVKIDKAVENKIKNEVEKEMEEIEKTFKVDFNNLKNNDANNYKPTKNNSESNATTNVKINDENNNKSIREPDCETIKKSDDKITETKNEETDDESSDENNDRICDEKPPKPDIQNNVVHKVTESGINLSSRPDIKDLEIRTKKFQLIQQIKNIQTTLYSNIVSSGMPTPTEDMELKDLETLYIQYYAEYKKVENCTMIEDIIITLIAGLENFCDGKHTILSYKPNLTN